MLLQQPYFISLFAPNTQFAAAIISLTMKYDSILLTPVIGRLTASFQRIKRP